MAPTARAPVERSSERLPAAAADAAAPAPLTPEQVQHRFHELAFGGTLAAAAPQQLQAITLAQHDVLETVATQPRFAPRRPMLLPQLMRAVNDDETSRRELAQIIARDPALAGSLLNLANSAVYRVSDRPIESVERAVAVLGTDGLRSLVAAAVTQPVFRVAEKQFAGFAELAWEHTYRCAAAAEAHAAIVEDSDPFAAQLLGLIFGLGTIVVFRVGLDYYSVRSTPPDAAVMAAFLDAQTGAVAHRVAASWDLSGRILNALADQIPSAELREPTSLGRSLAFGRLIAALSVLLAHRRLSEDTAKATVLASGATAFQFEQIWGRLHGRNTARSARPARAPG